jgi:outer membrane lipoprotein carrier protein
MNGAKSVINESVSFILHPSSFILRWPFILHPSSFILRSLALILLALPLSAAAAPAPAEIDRAVTAVAGTEAQFTQRFTPKGFKNSQIESGSVVFGTLPMMRWSYTKPEEKLFVFDGSKSWFYVPADKQVTVGRIDDARKGELPFLLLADPVARDKYFTIREQSQGGVIVTTLQSRDANTMVRQIVVTTSATSHQIQRIDYDDRQGNRTSFELSGYHPKRAPAETFRFDPPAGVQVVSSDQ